MRFDYNTEPYRSDAMSEARRMAKLLTKEGRPHTFKHTEDECGTAYIVVPYTK